MIKIFTNAWTYSIIACAALFINIITSHSASAEARRDQLGFQCDGAEGWYQILIQHNSGDSFAIATGAESYFYKLRMKVTEDHGATLFEGGRDGGPLVAGVIGSEKCGATQRNDRNHPVATAFR